MLQLTALGMGVGVATIGGLPRFIPRARAEHVGIVKPTPGSDFIRRSSNNAEMRWEAMASRGYLVPNAGFFVRNNNPTVHIDKKTWRLQVYGTGVNKTVQFKFKDILKMPSHSVTKFIECAGNARKNYAAHCGGPVGGTQWWMGAIGVAEWTGVPLREVLERAKFRKSTVDVMPEALDALGVNRPISIQKALDDETLLVYAMNGEELPEDHGAPVRALVPGWVGIANIKWVGSINVSETPLFTRWNTTSYVLFGDAYPDPVVLSTQDVKSAFELPEQGAEFPAGKNTLKGRSWSGVGTIKKVEVSFDEGKHWKEAKLRTPNLPQAWVRWDIKWKARPGQYNLQARATDSKGNTQPASVPCNDKGYVYWAVVSHPVTVRPGNGDNGDDHDDDHDEDDD